MKKGQGKRMLLGLIVVFALFQWVASALESTRGEAGVIVGVIVVAATLVVERLLFRDSISDSAREIGLGRPKALGIIVAIKIAALMLGGVALFAWQTDSTFTMYPNWQLLMIGLFFQAGIGEETLFRGYLFGHLRQQHTFGKAVFFAAIPFALVHLILFYSLPWSLAGASILLAIAMSFPLSKLFEMGGDTMWAPAIVHFAAQAIAKMFVPEGEHAWLYPFFVISASAIAPLLVYVVPLLRRSLRRREQAAAMMATMVVVVSVASARAQASDAAAAKVNTDWSAGTDASAPVAPKAERPDSAPDSRNRLDSKTSGEDFWDRIELTGDWDGKRTELRRRGIDVRFRLTQGYQFAVGSDRAYSGKLDSSFRIDFEKLAGWKSLSIQIKTETRFGRIMSANNGLPLNSAVLTPKSTGTTFSVTALNLTQLIPLGKEKGNFIAVGGGKYYSLDSSREPFSGGAGVTRFMNIIANGNPAVGRTVPIVANGATFAWIRNGSPFITFAVFDPIASPTSPGLKRIFREGMTFVPGLSFATRIGGKSGRHSLSATATTRKFTPFDRLAEVVRPGPPTIPVRAKSGSWSATYTFHQYLKETERVDGKRSGWGIFGTITIADRATNPVSRFATFGIGGNRFFRSRPKDQFGLAYGLTQVSPKLRAALSSLIRVRDEHVIEAFYNVSLAPWLSLTADLQVVRPVLRISRTGIIPGARMVIDF